MSSSCVLNLSVSRQPDESTCGPTCLQAVYRYYGDDIDVERIIRESESLPAAGFGGGALAVMLGRHALARGYRAALYTFNLRVFDPTWFDETGRVATAALMEKLEAQVEARERPDPRFSLATEHYLAFLREGGRIRMRDLTASMLARFIRKGTPVLTGLSATWLYREAREVPETNRPDDLRGDSAGHFVIVHGVDSERRIAMIADPLGEASSFGTGLYEAPMARLVPAIMLGVLTYDANFLVIEPSSKDASA